MCSEKKKSFQPYATATRESALFHKILAPCLPALLPFVRAAYRARWFFSHPLRTRVLPKYFPVISKLEFITAITVGEVILLIPLVLLCLHAYHATFVNPDVEESGEFAGYSAVLAFITANKTNSLFTLVLGIPFERMIVFHQIVSLFAVAAGGFHTYAAFQYDEDSKFSQTGENDLLRFLIDGNTNLTGTIGLGAMALLVLTSQFQILRRLLFNLWLVFHLVGAVATLIGLFLHDVDNFALVGLWWILDLVFRYGIQAGCQLRTQAKLTRIADDPGTNEPAIAISFPRPKGFQYNPGQFVQIAVPKLSIFEFHPISLSSSPHEEYVTLHIRQLGDWTKRLLNLTKDSKGIETEIWMEGPYGSLSVDLDDESRHKMALFVSGGIGMTPCQSIGKSLLYQHQYEGRQLKELKFVWAVRNLGMVRDIPPLTTEFENLSTRNATNRNPAHVDIYCTRTSEADPDTLAALPYNVHQGRPDLNAIFQDMKERALSQGEHSVAVFGCGPTSMLDQLKEACRQHSPAVMGCSDGVFFDLHTELFEF